MSNRPYVETSLNTNQKITFSNPVVYDDGKKVPADSKAGSIGSTYKGVKHINVVEAPLPESLPFSVGNEVNELFDIFKFKSQIIQFASAGAVRKNFDRGYTERQFWRSIINQDFTVELKFEAYYSGLVDVVNPIKNLFALSLPVERARANTYEWAIGHWDAPPLISVRFGNIIWFQDVLVKNIAVNWSNKLDNNFDPMSATVSMTMITENPYGIVAVNEHMRSGDITVPKNPDGSYLG